MRLFNFLVFILTVSLTISCSQGGEKASNNANASSDAANSVTSAAKNTAKKTVAKYNGLAANDMLSKIKESEDKLYKNYTNINPGNVEALNVLEGYKTFAKEYPKEAKAPSYLFKAAEIERTMKDYKSAIAHYQQICDNYPDYEKAPHSLFLMGFTYEEDMKNEAKAKETYELFLSKYPKHELSDDVQFSLNNLGKSAEEIIKEFEKKQKK